MLLILKALIIGLVLGVVAGLLFTFIDYKLIQKK